MDSIITLQKERPFFEVISDGIRIVIKCIRPIGSLTLLYMLPILLLSLFFLIISGMTFHFSQIDSFIESIDSAMMIVYVFLWIVLMFFAFLIANLIIYSAFKIYKENDGIVHTSILKEYMLRYFYTYAKALLVQVGVGLVIIFVVAVSILVSPALFFLFYILAWILGAYIFNILQFTGIVMMYEGKSVSQAVARCLYIVNNRWWETLAIIIFTSMLGSFLIYRVSFILSVIMILMGDITGTGQGQLEETFTIIMSSMSVLMILLGFISNYLLAGVRVIKYFDLIEKKEGNSLLEAINQIGEKEVMRFDNEGDF